MLLNVDWHNPRRPNPAPRRTASQAQSLCHLLFSHWRPSRKTYWQLLIGCHNEMGNNGVQFSCISIINPQWQPFSFSFHWLETSWGGGPPVRRWLFLCGAGAGWIIIRGPRSSAAANNGQIPIPTFHPDTATRCAFVMQYAANTQHTAHSSEVRSTFRLIILD